MAVNEMNGTEKKETPVNGLQDENASLLALVRERDVTIKMLHTTLQHQSAALASMSAQMISPQMMPVEAPGVNTDATIVRLEKELKDCNAQLETVQAAHKKKVADLEQSLEHTTQQFDNKNLELVNMEIDQENTCNTLTKQLEEAQHAHENAQNAVADLRATVTNLEEQLDTSKEAREALGEEVERLRAQLKDTKTGLENAHKEDIADLKNKLKDTKKKLEDTKTELGTVQNAHKEEVDQLTAKFRASDEELESLRAEHNKAIAGLNKQPKVEQATQTTNVAASSPAPPPPPTPPIPTTIPTPIPAPPPAPPADDDFEVVTHNKGNRREADPSSRVPYSDRAVTQKFWKQNTTRFEKLHPGIYLRFTDKGVFVQKSQNSLDSDLENALEDIRSNYTLKKKELTLLPHEIAEMLGGGGAPELTKLGEDYTVWVRVEEAETFEIYGHNLDVIGAATRANELIQIAETKSAERKRQPMRNAAVIFIDESNMGAIIGHDGSHVKPIKEKWNVKIGVFKRNQRGGLAAHAEVAPLPTTTDHDFENAQREMKELIELHTQYTAPSRTRSDVSNLVDQELAKAESAKGKRMRNPKDTHDVWEPPAPAAVTGAWAKSPWSKESK